MEKMIQSKRNNKYLAIIWGLSIAVPVGLALLLFMPYRVEIGSSWVHLLPHLNAMLNSTTVVVLIVGFIFIRNKNIVHHKYSMLIAFSLGTLFLISYVLYHSAAPSTIFGDINGNGVLEKAEKLQVGISRPIYLVLLLSHILLATIVVPLVLMALYYALSNKITSHKRIVKFTLPIWLYVSVTGVIIYLLISPYY